MTMQNGHDNNQPDLAEEEERPLFTLEVTPATKILLFLIILALILFLPTTIILLAGMMPTIIAYVVDRTPEKYEAVTVGSMNVCGVLPFILDLWMTDNTLEYVLILITDPITWLTMYVAAGVGWLILMGVPRGYAMLSSRVAQAKLSGLQKTRVAMLEEWGAELGRIEAERRDQRAQERMERAKRERELEIARRKARAAAAKSKKK